MGRGTMQWSWCLPAYAAFLCRCSALPLYLSASCDSRVPTVPFCAGALLCPHISVRPCDSGAPAVQAEDCGPWSL